MDICFLRMHHATALACILGKEKALARLNHNRHLVCSVLPVPAQCQSLYIAVAYS